MSDPINHLYTLHTNPFLFATTLHGFYESLGPRQHSVLLAYLVLPIVLEQKNRDFLQKARSNSSLRTMLTHRDLLTAIPQRLEDYREVTMDTLKYLVSAHLLEVKGTDIVLGPSRPTDLTAPSGTVAAARKLAEFFNPFDVPAIYRLLGVMQL
jgi:hypothetical protein